MKNEYLILYAIVDMFAYHFLDLGRAVLDENNRIIFVQNPKSYTKHEKRVYEEIIKIISILDKKLNKEAFLAVKNKYNNLLKGFATSKLYEEYAPILVGLSILSYYTKAQGKKLLNTHPRSVEKTLELAKNDAEFRYLDKFVINSLKLGEKFYKEMSK